MSTGWPMVGLPCCTKWIGDAAEVGVSEPNAMVLATVDGWPSGQPDGVIRSVDHDGITFYTNYDSAKGSGWPPLRTRR